jgi:hypothetical protein
MDGDGATPPAPAGLKLAELQEKRLSSYIYTV